MEIKTILKCFVTEELLNNDMDIDDDDNLLADELVDSIGLIRIVAFIEETYGMEIPPEDVVIENFRTISLIADYLERAKP